MPKAGYYFISDQTQWLPDMSTLTLTELLDQLSACGYRCEAGKLELNVAYIELRRRAEEEKEIKKAPIAGEDIKAGNVVYFAPDGMAYKSGV